MHGATDEIDIHATDIHATILHPLGQPIRELIGRKLALRRSQPGPQSRPPADMDRSEIGPYLGGHWASSSSTSSSPPDNGWRTNTV